MFTICTVHHQRNVILFLFFLIDRFLQIIQSRYVRICWLKSTSSHNTNAKQVMHIQNSFRSDLKPIFLAPYSDYANDMQAVHAFKVSIYFLNRSQRQHSSKISPQKIFNHKKHLHLRLEKKTGIQNKDWRGMWQVIKEKIYLNDKIIVLVVVITWHRYKNIAFTLLHSSL